MRMQKRREIKYRDGRISMPLMLNAIASDSVRNACIADHIVRCMAVGRHVIVLTDRLIQLNDLRDLLLSRNVSADRIGFYIGSSTGEERERGKICECILETYSMAKEGLDIPRLDTLVMATPKGDVIQASRWRVQRKHAHKHARLLSMLSTAFRFSRRCVGSGGTFTERSYNSCAKRTDCEE